MAIDFPTNAALRKLINSWQPQPASQAEPTALPFWWLEREQDYERTIQMTVSNLMPSWQSRRAMGLEAYRALLSGEASLSLVIVDTDGGVELQAQQVRG